VYCLDTNAVIHYFKGAGGVAERLLAVSPAAVMVPGPVVYEIAVGVLRSTRAAERREQFQGFLEVVRVQPFGAPEAWAAARLRTALEARGTPIGPLDTLIAGTALANGATLVTRNVREFERVEGLVLENWYDG